MATVAGRVPLGPLVTTQVQVQTPVAPSDMGWLRAVSGHTVAERVALSLDAVAAVLNTVRHDSLGQRQPLAFGAVRVGHGDVSLQPLLLPLQVLHHGRGVVLHSRQLVAVGGGHGGTQAERAGVSIKMSEDAQQHLAELAAERRVDEEVDGGVDDEEQVADGDPLEEGGEVEDVELRHQARGLAEDEDHDDEHQNQAEVGLVLVVNVGARAAALHAHQLLDEEDVEDEERRERDDEDEDGVEDGEVDRLVPVGPPEDRVGQVVAAGPRRLLALLALPGVGGEEAGHVVEDRDQRDGHDHHQRLAARAEPGGAERVTDGDVALHRHGHRDPHVARLQGHHREVDGRVDDGVDVLAEVHERVVVQVVGAGEGREDDDGGEEDAGVGDDEAAHVQDGGGLHLFAPQHHHGQRVAHQPHQHHDGQEDAPADELPQQRVARHVGAHVLVPVRQVDLQVDLRHPQPCSHSASRLLPTMPCHQHCSFTVVSTVLQCYQQFHCGTNSFTVVSTVLQWYQQFHCGINSFTVVSTVLQWYQQFNCDINSLTVASTVSQ